MLTTTRYDIGDGTPPEWLPIPSDCKLTPKPTYYNHPIERTGFFELTSARDAGELYSDLRASLVAAAFEVDAESEIAFPVEATAGMGLFTATRGEKKVSVSVSRQAGEQMTAGSLSYSESLAITE